MIDSVGTAAHDPVLKPVIGLVGGIGSGKNTVAALLGEVGAAVIDSDQLSHEQLAIPEVIATIIQWWGASILRSDGSVDRSRVAAVVFADSSQRLRLEGLLHPRIAARRAQLLDQYQADQRCTLIVLNSPLLLEAGLDRLCDALVFIEVSREIRLQRVASRGWEAPELDRRENAQWPLDFKRARADYVLDNNNCLDRLRAQVRDLYPKLVTLGKR